MKERLLALIDSSLGSATIALHIRVLVVLQCGAIVSGGGGQAARHDEAPHHPCGPTYRHGSPYSACKPVAELAPVIAELRAAGITTPTGIAAALVARGVRTTLGHRYWYPSQVAQLLKRLEG
jgi:hypothetical protein